MPHPINRPGPVLAAGVLLLIVGGLSLVGVVCLGSMALFLDALMPGQNVFQPDPFIIEEVPSAAWVEPTAMLLGGPLGIVMIVAGIGILQVKPWGRWLGMGVAVTDLCLTLLHGLYQAVLIFPVQNRLLALNAQGALGGIADALEGGSWGMLGSSVVFNLIVWGIVLRLLNTKVARAAFADEFDGEPPRRPERSRYDGYDDDDDLPPIQKPPPDTGISDRW